MDEVEHPQVEAPPAVHRPAVADVMSAPVVTIQSHESLWTAVERFLATGMRHLVVLSGQRCVGVISDRHVIAAWPFDPLGLRYRRVAEVLRETFPAVAPACSVALAAELMIEHQVDALPVVDEDATVVGVVTSSDLVRVVAQAMR